MPQHLFGISVKLKKQLLFILLTCSLCYCRIHNLKIENDDRHFISLSSFGYYKGGSLNVSLRDFHFSPLGNYDNLFGFVFEKIANEAVQPHFQENRDNCLLKDAFQIIQKKEDLIFFFMDQKNKRLQAQCAGDGTVVERLRIYNDTKYLPTSSYIENVDRNEQILNVKEDRGSSESCVNLTFPMPVDSVENNSPFRYNTQFIIYIPTKNESALYQLYFVNCAKVKVDFSMRIVEHNIGNYLSVGEMPLPNLYFSMALLFFTAAVLWTYVIGTSRNPVFKIHYLMAILVYLKATALLFHGIDYHFIQIQGEHVSPWSVLYYITYLLKGLVLFITIILIGTGWTFIKHILSPRDKKVFLIVIPLQVFANVAKIIMEESEKGDFEYGSWLYVFTVVDLICCFAILYPIMWSVNHLQDAAHIDGKEAINLQKLKLFRRFYIIIVCYIYFTRIIVHLLEIAMPFEYTWLDELFLETATFIFFVSTGYKFRPTPTNPYFQVPADDNDDDEMDIVISQFGLTEGLTKLNRISEYGEDDKDSLIISKRENSHDYD